MVMNHWSKTLQFSLIFFCFVQFVQRNIKLTTWKIHMMLCMYPNVNFTDDAGFFFYFLLVLLVIYFRISQLTSSNNYNTIFLLFCFHLFGRSKYIGLNTQNTQNTSEILFKHWLMGGFILISNHLTVFSKKIK